MKNELPFWLFLFITLFDIGSTPKDIAGSESVTKYIHNNCTASKGLGSENIMANRIDIISPMLQDNRK